MDHTTTTNNNNYITDLIYMALFDSSATEAELHAHPWIMDLPLRE